MEVLEEERQGLYKSLQKKLIEAVLKCNTENNGENLNNLVLSVWSVLSGTPTNVTITNDVLHNSFFEPASDGRYKFVSDMNRCLDHILDAILIGINDYVDCDEEVYTGDGTGYDMETSPKINTVIRPMMAIVCLLEKFKCMGKTCEAVQKRHDALIARGCEGWVPMITLFVQTIITKSGTNSMSSWNSKNIADGNVWETIIIFLERLIPCIGPKGAGVFLTSLLSVPKDLISAECPNLLKEKYVTCFWYCCTELDYDHASPDRYVAEWRSKFHGQELIHTPFVHAVVNSIKNGRTGIKLAHRFCRSVIRMRYISPVMNVLYETYHDQLKMTVRAFSNHIEHANSPGLLKLKRVVQEFDKVPQKIKDLDSMVCSVCTKSVKDLRIPNMMVCSGCNSQDLFFCSQKCHMTHWK